jgi:hypothetical protein
VTSELSQITEIIIAVQRRVKSVFRIRATAEQNVSSTFAVYVQLLSLSIFPPLLVASYTRRFVLNAQHQVAVLKEPAVLRFVL